MDSAACPCINLKHGAAALAFCAYVVAWSRVLLGGDFEVVIAGAVNGTLPPDTALLLVAWVGTATVGAAALIVGYRATRTHYDPFDAFALAAAVAGALFFLYAVNACWSLPARGCGVWLAVLSRGVFYAGLSYNAANIWLQLRGPLAFLASQMRPMQRPPLQWPDAPPQWDVPPVDPPQLAEYREVLGALTQEVEQSRNALVTWQQAVAERDRTIGDLAADLARVTTTRDRYQANGKRIAAEKREMDAIFKVPGVYEAARRAARSATHPDRATSDADRRARTAKFQEIEAAFDRIRDRQS